MAKRITLLRNYGEFQMGADFELVDADGNDQADDLIRRGIAKLAKVQRVYGHVDEMTEKQRQQALEQTIVADAAGGYRQVEARIAALGPYRK